MFSLKDNWIDIASHPYSLQYFNKIKRGHSLFLAGDYSVVQKDLIGSGKIRFTNINTWILDNLVPIFTKRKIVCLYIICFM